MSVVSGKGERRLLALASKERLLKILERMLDEYEFFSDFGIRSSVEANSPFDFPFDILNAYHLLDFQNHMNTNRGEWM